MAIAQFMDATSLSMTDLLLTGLLLVLALWVLAFLLFVPRTAWKVLQTQRAILAALEAMNKANAETLAALRGVQAAAAPAGAESDLGADEDDGDDGETPADFVYCPVCSTRIEVDPSIRNVNVVCPDCKKPFHIH